MRGVHINPASSPLANGLLLATEGSSALPPNCKLRWAGDQSLVPAGQENQAVHRSAQRQPAGLLPETQATGWGVSIHTKPKFGLGALDG